MNEQVETLCDLWERDQVEAKFHSRLYHLEPIGVGSPMVESLTSYVTRLADAHSVHPRVLVTDEILPLLNRAYLYRDGHPMYQALTALWRQSAVLNGTSTTTRNWAEVLEWLTMRPDLRFLTMLFWNDVLPPRGLVRRMRAWCPVCYEEWRENGQVIYEPLLWALEVISICPRHRLRLQLCCPYPDCGCTQLPIASRSQLEFCSRCDRWLGSPLQSETGKRALLGEEGCERQEWVVNAVGELLAAAPNLAVKPRREAIAIAVAAYVDGVAGGSVSALARQLQARRSSIQHWRQGQGIPQLGSLLQICSTFGTSPLYLLTGNAREIAPNQENTHNKKNPTSDKHKRRFRSIATESLQRALEAVLQDAEDCPPSMREVARRLGHDPSNLYKHFPDLCRAISKRYLDYQSIATESHQRALEAVLQDAEDCPPSMQEVARRLGHDSSDLRKHFPDLCRAISTRYLDFKAMKRLERLERICDEVRQATLKVHGQGCYPGMKQVRKLLNKSTSFRQREVRAVWHDTLRELGWEH